jgi:hypothetical protein
MNTFFNETNAQLLQEIKHQNLSGDEFEFKNTSKQLSIMMISFPLDMM